MLKEISGRGWILSCGHNTQHTTLTHNTWHSRSQISPGDANFEQFITVFTWLQQKIGTWFSEAFRYLLKGGFSSGIVLSVSLHLLKPRSFQQPNLHVWKISDHSFEKEWEYCFSLLTAADSFPWRRRLMGRVAGLFAATAAEAEGTSLCGLCGPQDADGRCVQELHASQGIASRNHFHTVLVLSWTPYFHDPSLHFASVFLRYRYVLKHCYIDDNNYLHNKLTWSRQTDGRKSERRTKKGHTNE